MKTHGTHRGCNHANPTGLGARLQQHSSSRDDHKVIAYASRALSPVNNDAVKRNEKPWPLFGQWNDFTSIFTVRDLFYTPTTSHSS